MLKVSKITQYYNDVKALDKVSFSVKPGEITGFLGPNGAGKTTTLKVITGSLEPSEGIVMFKNKLLNQSILKDIGYLPESNPLYKNMRVDEFLTFAARVKGIKDKENIREIVAKCGLIKVLTQEIETLSKGYKQRVGLAKALIGDPHYLFLDEPTEGLDPNQKEEILKLIKDFSKDKVILFSSHVLSEVTQLADRVIIISKGKIVAEGDRDSLVKEHFKNSTIVITTDAPAQKLNTALKNIKTVYDMTTLDKSRKKMKQYEVIATEDDKTPIEIFDAIVKNKWKLSEMYVKSQGLDELFRELTK